MFACSLSESKSELTEMYFLGLICLAFGIDCIVD